MGLDITLYRYDDLPAAQALEAEYERESTAIWDRICGGRKYEALSEADKERARNETDALKDRLGLVGYGEAPGKQKIERKSEIDPEHYCETGYLRSSYNEGGFDSVARTQTGKEGFYYIFGVERGHDYHVKPDWRASRARALELVAELQAAQDAGAYRVTTERGIGRGPSDTAEALALFRKEMGKKSAGGFGSYSNAAGAFFLQEPLEVAAVMLGQQYGSPAAFLVYKSDLSWYVKAAKIAAEMCEYVLAHDRPDQFVLHWSS